MSHVRMFFCRRTILIACLAASLTITPGIRSQPAPDGTWTANADLDNVAARTMPGLGAMQGVTFRDGKVYLFGDVWDARPRVGVIREYTTDYEPTGRVIWLRRDDKPLLRHPTGLTHHPRFGTFLGDTVNRKAIIYRFDWEKALADGDLRRAVLDIIDDDAAVNGCRPEFVTIGGHDYLTTADYGDARPEVRLYEPELLLRAKRSSAPGVVAHRILCGPFNQSLHWDASTGQLTCPKRHCGPRLAPGGVRPRQSNRGRPLVRAGGARAATDLQTPRRTRGLPAAGRQARIVRHVESEEQPRCGRGERHRAERVGARTVEACLTHRGGGL